jgi:hypothetical protein
MIIGAAEVAAPRHIAAANPPSAAATIPFIDVHAHMDQRDAAGTQQMLATMMKENASKIFLLVPPYSYQDPSRC